MAKKMKENKTGKNSDIKFMDSIRTKLISVMVLVAAVPLLIAIIVSYITSTNKALADAQDSLEWQAWYIQDCFLRIVDNNMTVIKTLGENPTVINFLHGDAGIPVDAVQATLAVCDGVLGDGENTSITDVTGMQVARGRGECIDVSDREYYKQAIQGVDYVSNITISKSNGRRMVTFAVPITDGEKVIGIVHRNFDLDNFYQLLSTEAEHAFFVDRNGQLAATSKYKLGDGAHEEEYRDTAEFFTSGKEEGFYYGDIGNGEEGYVAYARDSISGFIIVAVKDKNEVLSAARSSAMIVIAVGLVLLIVAAVISFLMAKSFIEPIEAVGDSLTALADGRFSQVDGFDKRKDEFGAISRATNSVIDTLDHIVSNIKKSAASVGTSSEELSDMANQISQTAEDVSNAVQEIASGATQQADEIQSASENVGRIGDAVANVQNSTDDLSNIAQKMKEASEISSKSLTSLQDSSSEMTAKIDDISRTIGATQDAVNNISEKVEGITSIATQTNLLSLNASIEAARAGEAGKGFAVVAEEIGKLAEDSKTMADDIKKEMESLLEQSKAAVQAAEDVKQGNNDQQIALGETLDAVNGMLSWPGA